MSQVILSRQITSRRDLIPGRALIVLNYYGPALDHHLCSARGHGHDLDSATHPCSVVFAPGLEAWAAAPDMTCHVVDEGGGMAAVTVSQPDRLADVAALNAGCLVAVNFSPEAHPCPPAWLMQVLHISAADYSVHGRHCFVADNGSARYAVRAAAPPGDTGPRKTAAGKQEAGRELEQSCVSTYPIRFDDAPIQGPSADPSGAAHSASTRESTAEAAGSSARGLAGCIAVQPPVVRNPRDRCTTNWRTSRRPGRPSTCRRKRNSWHSPAGRNRPDNPVPVRVQDTGAN